MLVKFEQKVGSYPNAGTTDRGKPLVYRYPGRKLNREKVVDAAPDSQIVQSAREKQFVSMHHGLKTESLLDQYEDSSDEKKIREKKFTSSYHGVEFKSRSKTPHFGGVGSVRSTGG